MPTTEHYVVVNSGPSSAFRGHASSLISFNHNVYAGGECISRQVIRGAPWRRQQVADALRGSSD